MFQTQCANPHDKRAQGTGRRLSPREKDAGEVTAPGPAGLQPRVIGVQVHGLVFPRPQSPGAWPAAVQLVPCRSAHQVGAAEMPSGGPPALHRPPLGVPRLWGGWVAWLSDRPGGWLRSDGCDNRERRAHVWGVAAGGLTSASPRPDPARAVSCWVLGHSADPRARAAGRSST